MEAITMMGFTGDGQADRARATMTPTGRRGSRVIYVAESARVLPPEVQEWLSQADHPATASPDVYDALALLANGRKPLALIVNIDAVDWSEISFFEHAARLSASTAIYVSGPDHTEDRIKAACARGALRFDGEALSERLRTAPSVNERRGPDRLLAGTLQPPSTPAGAELEDRDDATAAADDSEQPERTPRPPVRLYVEQSEEAEAEREQAETAAAPPVPVPWVPNPARPRRTPPPGSKPAADARDEAGGSDPQAGARPTPVELTPEELAALLGKPRPPDAGSVGGQGK
jgi:hypothetical protein